VRQRFTLPAKDLRERLKLPILSIKSPLLYQLSYSLLRLVILNTYVYFTTFVKWLVDTYSDTY